MLLELLYGEAVAPHSQSFRLEMKRCRSLSRRPPSMRLPKSRHDWYSLYFSFHAGEGSSALWSALLEESGQRELVTAVC